MIKVQIDWIGGWASAQVASLSSESSLPERKSTPHFGEVPFSNSTLACIAYILLIKISSTRVCQERRREEKRRENKSNDEYDMHMSVHTLFIAYCRRNF